MGITISRAYSFDLSAYEIITEMKLTDTPSGKFHYEKLKDILGDQRGSAILGFVDNCNHVHPKNDYVKHGFHLEPTPGRLLFKVPGTYKKGELFNYQYQSQLTSSKTVFNYGFYYRQNPYKIVMVNFYFHKNFLTKQKFDILKDLSLLFPREIELMEGFFNQNQYDSMNMEFPLNYERDLRLSNILRLFVFNDNYLTIDEIKMRIMDEQELDYDSAVRSASFLRGTITHQMTLRNETISHEHAIYSKAETDKYMKDNDLHKDPKQDYTHLIRSNLINLHMEMKRVMNRHMKYANDQIEKSLNDQFKKLRNHFAASA